MAPSAAIPSLGDAGAAMGAAILRLPAREGGRGGGAVHGSTTVRETTMSALRASAARRPPLDPESRAWLTRLAPGSADRDEAVAALHALLLRAARFELARRRASLAEIRGGDHDDLAQQSADDALVAVLAKLGEFRGESRFTTWAYKFALLEAGVKARRRAWQGRELPLGGDERPPAIDGSPTTAERAETRELLGGVWEAVERELTPHRRRVLVALTIDDVPIDVLAERLGTTRGALYKTLHDARRTLRAALEARGFALGETTEVGGS